MIFINNKVIYVSFINNILKKLFFLFITIFSLTLSDKFYTYVILLFLLSNYIYEISSFSIPKIFNNYLKIHGERKLSMLAGLSLYLCLLFFIISLMVFSIGDNLILKYFDEVDRYFVLSFIFLGISISINDLVDKYNFLKLKNLRIYYYDIIEILITFILIFFTYFKFNLILLEKINLLIFLYSIIKLLFAFFKLFIFKLDITFSFKKISNIFYSKFLKELLVLTLPIFLISILFIIQFSISRFVIIYYEGYRSFSIFAFHIQMIELISLFFLAIHQLSGPKISIMLKNQQLKLIPLFQSKLLKIFTSIIPILIFFLYLFFNDIVKLFNLSFTLDKILFILLSLNFIFIYLFLTMYQYIIMKSQTKFLLIFISYSLFLNIFLSILLTPFFSIIGLAIANLLSNLFLFCFCNYRIKFFFFRKKDFKNILITIIKIFICLIFLNLYYFLNFKSVVYNIDILKVIYFIFVFLIIEFLFDKKYSMIYVINNFVSFINTKLKFNEK